MGTVRGVCAIPPDWHSGTFCRSMKKTLEDSDRVWLKRSLEFFDFRKFELKRYISEKTAMFKLENREKHKNN